MKRLRVLLVTGKAAEELIRRYAEDAARLLNIHVDVVSLPVMVASMINTEIVEKFLPRVKPDYKSYDIIMLPGTCRADAKRLSERLGARFVRGPVSPADIPRAISMLLEGREAEELSIIEDVERIVSETFERARRVCIDGFCVYRRPGYTLAVEIPAHSVNEELEKILPYVLEGEPDILVYGDEPYMSDDEFRRLFNVFIENVADKVSIGIETSKVERMIYALDHGAKLVSGVSSSMLPELRDARDRAFVVIVPFDPHGAYPRSCEERVEALTRGVERAKRLGFEYIILDPALVPPPLGFTRILPAYETVAKNLDYPLLFSLATLEDALATDPFPVFLFASGIGVEVGADFYWVVAKRGFEASEARVALDVTVAAHVKHVQVSSLGFDLRSLTGPESKPVLKGSYVEVIPVRERVEPTRFDRGYVRVFADKGEIKVEYVEGGKTFLLKGKDGLSIARVLVNKFSINPEHAAYIGYELAKAELAAKYGIGYSQDEPIEPVFTRLSRLVKRRK